MNRNCGFDDIKSIAEIGSKIIQKFDDPHNLSNIINSGLENVITDITNDDKYTYTEKFMFLAQIDSLRRKKNLFEIIEGIKPFLNEDADINALDSDWLVDFYDKASKITTADFKFIWSRILAEELNNPNIISKRLLHNLFLMNKEDAENFINLSRFCFYDKRSNEVYPVIFYREHSSAYAKSKITFEILKSLEHFSLIECDFESGFVFNLNTEKIKKYLLYTNHQIEIRADKIKLGNVKLTADGRKLFDIIEKHNNNRIMDYTVDIWRKYGYEVKIN